MNRVLKVIVSPQDDNHNTVIGTTILLFFMVYVATIFLVQRCGNRPSVVHTVGLLGGHIMGFSTKQIYIAAVRAAIRNINAVSLSVVYLSIPPLAAYVFVFHWIIECVRTNRFPAKNALFQGLMWRRRRAVIIDAIEDAFAIALGYSVFAACFGTATFAHPIAQRSLFKVEGACYRYSEESSDSPDGHSSRNQSFSSDREANRHQEDGSLHSDVVNMTGLCLVIMMVVFPVASYSLRQKGKEVMNQYLATSRSKRKGRQKSCALWLLLLSASLPFALGFALNHIMSFWLEAAAEDESTTDVMMLSLIALLAVVAWLISTATQTVSSVKKTLRERKEANKEDSQRIERSRCTRWRIYMFVPVITRMWIIHVAFSFEAFFDCLQFETEHHAHWPRAYTEAVFYIVALCSLIGVSMFCGSDFVARQERGLKEEIEEEDRYRSPSMVLEMDAGDG